MKTREEQREERRQFEADVYYEVWRSGGNPDRIDPDRLSDCYYDHHDVNDCASRILKSQRPKPQESEQEEQFLEDEP
jgi:hypothetical protein